MSSNLGILVADSGATRILEVTRLVDTVPSLYWYLTQVTTRYASPDASVKVCRGTVSTCEFNCRQRATYTSDNSVNSWNHFLACLAWLGSSGSSQSNPEVHISCSRIFAPITYGARNPIGSNSMAILRRKFRLVNWNFSSGGFTL